jgi:hypothetical protein
MVSETENNFDFWYVFFREELNDVALFDFHIFDNFPLIERRLAA